LRIGFVKFPAAGAGEWLGFALAVVAVIFAVRMAQRFAGNRLPAALIP
jgi:hypothetical protein